MIDKTANFSARFFQLPRILRLVWSSSPGWTSLWTALLVVQGLLPVVPLYLIRELVDGVVNATKGNGSWVNVKPLALLAGLIALSMLLIEVTRAFGDWIRAAQSECVSDKIAELIHVKSSSVDLAFYESADYYDHLHRARDDAASRSLAVLENVGTLFQNSITLVAMATVLVPYGYWVPPALMISTLPALWVVFQSDRNHHEWWAQSTSNRRWTKYYDFMLTSDSTAAEVRLFDLANHFQTAYRIFRQKLREEKIELVRNRSIARFGAAAFALTVSGILILIMVWRVLKGFATFGDLALFYQAFSRGQDLMRALLSNLGQIYTNALFVGNLFEFLGLESQVTDPKEPMVTPASMVHGISFHDVSFKYPDSNKLALNKFNLSIRAGQIVAIVGANGAGKSTLVRLLCRFYDPNSGSIELDGIDIRNFTLRELRRKLTVLFQFPVPYHASVAENIALGDINLPMSYEAIRKASKLAGASDLIMGLPHGYQSLLGKWFADGVELSAGEWQRIALARAFYRQAEIIILDEPTSFMDSWAEMDWFERLRKLANGRTVILITHRFTLAKKADIIHVMDQSEILDSGSHQELLAHGGLYAQAWESQMGSDIIRFDKEIRGLRC